MPIYRRPPFRPFGGKIGRIWQPGQAASTTVAKRILVAQVTETSTARLIAKRVLVNRVIETDKAHHLTVVGGTPPPRYSAHFREETGSTSGSEPSYLLEISHPQLSDPIRVCNDSQDIVSRGDIFQACAFRIQLPDDVAQTMPRVPISIDNIGREMTQWLEASNGGRGATVKIMQVMRDTPDVIEQSFDLALINVHQNSMEISGELGLENFLDIPCLAATYNIETTPAIF